MLDIYWAATFNRVAVTAQWLVCTTCGCTYCSYHISISSARKDRNSKVILPYIVVGSFHSSWPDKLIRNLITIQLMIATGNFYYPTDLCQDGLTYIKFHLSVVVVHKVNIPSKCPVSKWLQYVIKLESQFPIFHGAIGCGRVLRLLLEWKESFRCPQQALDQTLACLAHYFGKSVTLLDFTLSSFWKAN